MRRPLGKGEELAWSGEAEPGKKRADAGDKIPGAGVGLTGKGAWRVEYCGELSLGALTWRL